MTLERQVADQHPDKAINKVGKQRTQREKASAGGG
jgi:hypothetical protein